LTLVILPYWFPRFFGKPYMLDIILPALPSTAPATIPSFLSFFSPKAAAGVS